MTDPRTAHGFRTHVSEQLYSVMRQPVVDIKTEDYLHYEWLVRFDHDTKLEGVLRPAEINGVIRDLDLSMLVQAILVLNEDPEGVGVAINLSGASLDNSTFEKSISACLTALTAPSEKIVLELTESWDMHDLSFAQSLIKMLKDRGHHICLDDVGAGAASIRYLRKLPADWLKIDSEFVWAAYESERECAILKALLTLREPLGVRFIAEGVEHAGHLNFVADLGIDAAQGYGIAKPQPETRIKGNQLNK